MRQIIIVLILFGSSSVYSQDISQFQTFVGYKYYVDAQPINKNEVEEMLTKYPEALSDWQKAKVAGGLTFGLIAAELGFGFWAISNAAQLKPVGPQFIGMLSTGVAAVVFSFRRRKLLRSALLSHNQLNNSPGLSLSGNGIGLSWQF